MRSLDLFRDLAASGLLVLLLGCGPALDAGLGVLGIRQQRADERPTAVTSIYEYGPAMGLELVAVSPPSAPGWNLFNRPFGLLGQEARCLPIPAGLSQVVSVPDAQPVTPMLDLGDWAQISVAMAPYQAVRAAWRDDQGAVGSSLARQAAWLGTFGTARCSRSVFAYVTFFPGLGSNQPVVVSR